MRISVFCILSLWVACTAEPARSQAPGTISGTVLDDKSKAVAGTYVVATPLGPAGGLTLTATSDAAGAFTIAGVKPATYQLCVQASGTAVLDPCRWGQPTQVAIAAGQTATVALRVITGSVLRVRVKDAAKKYLSSVRTGSPDLMIGVLSPASMFFPLNLAAKTDAEHTYEAAIPADTALRVAVYGGQLQLADEKGAALAAGANLIPVQHASGRANPDVNLNITGKK